MSDQTPPPSLWCSPGVHFAWVDEDIVVLDVEHDRYLCLPGAGARLTLGDDGRIDSPEPDILEDFAAAGLVTTDPATSPRRAIPPPTRALTPCANPSPALVRRALLSHLASALSFRGRSLSALVAPVRHRRRGAANPRRLEQLVGAARRARPWIPFEGECLKRTFQLRAMLAREGFAADWVFGVRTWPFGAHCWLQINDQVIGDRLERVARYTPIMKA